MSAPAANASLDVTLLRGFREDRRMSMDVYADGLLGVFGSSSEFGCRVTEFTPTLCMGGGRGAWKMRLARYVGYPLQVRRAARGVCHIADQGYGHLLHTVDAGRTVVTVHDLIPIVRWRGDIPGIARGSKPWLNGWSVSALHRAAHLIAISENTKADLIKYCGCDQDRISVVYYGIESAFRVYSAVERAEARQRWRMPDDGMRRILVIGSSFYKNQLTALRAFAALRSSTDIPLQLVGVAVSSPSWLEEVRRLGLGDVIREIEHVCHADMPDIYNCVDALLFPSVYEGFGRPPIEAMACGTPSIVSNVAALAEAVGCAALTCDPWDHRALAANLHTVVCESKQRSELVQRGLDWAKRFSWRENARQTAMIYQSVCG